MEPNIESVRKSLEEFKKLRDAANAYEDNAVTGVMNKRAFHAHARNSDLPEQLEWAIKEIERLQAQLRSLHGEKGYPMNIIHQDGKRYVHTGEYRPPQKGEWIDQNEGWIKWLD